MQNESLPSVRLNDTTSSPVTSRSRVESLAYYIFLAMVILAPLVFWPSLFEKSQDAVKIGLISLGSLISVILYLAVAFKEKKILVPKKSLVWPVVLILISLLISAFSSTHVMKSLFGQGYEIGTASFVAILFLSGLAAFLSVARRVERSLVVLSGVTASFLVVYVVQFMRFVFGPAHLTLGYLATDTATSSIFGNWLSLSMFSGVVLLVLILAATMLPLSRTLKSVYWILSLVAFSAMFVINNHRAWILSAIVWFGIFVYLSYLKPVVPGTRLYSWSKRIALLPLIIFLVAVLFVWRGTALTTPTITRLHASYYELSLNWRYTLDVASDTIKQYPLFGVGPNHFDQAYLTYKPTEINATDGWSVEFQNGFGLLPTFVATEGIVGLITWLILLACYVLVVVKVFRSIPADPVKRFVLMASGAASVFLILALIVSVPAVALALMAFVMSGVFVGSATAFGILAPHAWWPRGDGRMVRLVPACLIVLIVVGIVWSVVYIKKVAGHMALNSGITQLQAGHADAADRDFILAQKFDTSDLYWQARAEAAMTKVNQLAASLNANTPASTTEAIQTQAVSLINQALADATQAIAYDHSNYMNYVSLARVAEMGTTMKAEQAYPTAVSAYANAIKLNPGNLALYLSLARLQASQNKLDDAERTTGLALAVKNNYLEGIFLLSQIEAAKGNVKDAITAAQVASQINPTNPLIFFQLGLLEYMNKDYAAAVTALETAVKLQPDYANAKYFLGLSYVRQNRIADATAQFTDLSTSNPGNQEVAFVLSNLRAGRSPFSDAQPPLTTSPEKRPSLPLKEKAKK